MVYSIQRDEGAQALENHLNVIDSKKSLRRPACGLSNELHPAIRS